MATESQSATRAGGGKSASGHPLARLIDGLELRFRASGHKSSEGDGRTAADIEREIAARQQSKEN